MTDFRFKPWRTRSVALSMPQDNSSERNRSRSWWPIRRAGRLVSFSCCGRHWFSPVFLMRRLRLTPNPSRRHRRLRLMMSSRRLEPRCFRREPLAGCGPAGWSLPPRPRSAREWWLASLPPVIRDPTQSPETLESATATSAPTRTTEQTREPGVALPAGEPLSPRQFVVPRGRDDATQLSLASVSGVVPPRTLPSAVGGRNSWPVLSTDRRTIIYINYVAGSLRTMAADGSGDRALIKSRPNGCGQISRSWPSSVGPRVGRTDSS